MIVGRSSRTHGRLTAGTAGSIILRFNFNPQFT